MIINVDLNSQMYITAPTDTVTVPVDEARLCFTSRTFRLGQLIVSVSGIQIAADKNRSIDLGPFLKEGAVLEISVALIVAGRPVMTWYLLPITVRSVDIGYELLPEISALRERCAAAEDRAAKHEAALIELKKLIENI